MHFLLKQDTGAEHNAAADQLILDRMEEKRLFQFMGVVPKK